jgi:hypothetical protein
MERKLNLYTLIKWKLRGFTTKEAKKWINKGYSLMEALNLRRKGVNPEKRNE